MNADQIFRLQCQAMHARKSISALATQLQFDPDEMTVAAFLHLLDEVHSEPGHPAKFNPDLLAVLVS